MALIVSSIFRDSSGYVDRWVEQVAALHEQRPLKVVIAEGDSTDDTGVKLAQALAAAPFPSLLLHVEHGGPKFGSVDDPQRWAQIAYVCNTVRRRVAAEGCDQWLYVESDLVWSVDTPVALLDALDRYPAVAAMSLRDGRFYDVWGHVGLDGQRFAHEPPYHPSINGDRYVEIASAGSCFALRGPLVPVVEFSDEDCIRGIGRTLRQAGASLWLDTQAEVYHP